MKKSGNEQLDGKRGKKGGTQFPRYSLEHLYPFLKNLASKTHTNSISLEQLSAGVFGLGANSTAGKVKLSALKQFGLITGDYRQLKNTELTTKITMSDGAELKSYLQQAFQKVSVFVNTLNTYQNSKTDKTKIGQYAVSTLKVHPDMKDDFVSVLIESAKISELCTIDGNSVLFGSLSKSIPNETITTDSIENETEENTNEDFIETPTQNQVNFEPRLQSNHSRKSGQISNINVNIDVDPSMDPEKLEKLLKLLKNYGAI
ncbi:MAG: hypothetical protein A2W86_14140 [Bacteroidetes bacterium GWD2_45_23]|jgi:hypothetical protein|nr:MAG: hypothetical protein A2W87_03570 [Bacteroidetes bacterium GWC2_46_850]OFX84777.1 MAG: hypothetical protein A2W86_14140 [Bacteroidetes bacterium GWD2_45_23]